MSTTVTISFASAGVQRITVWSVCVSVCVSGCLSVCVSVC